MLLTSSSWDSKIGWVGGDLAKLNNDFRTTLIIIIIIIKLDIVHSMSPDFRGNGSGATHGAGTRRLDGDSLD